ncbi:hypothetical protein B0H34DRAFT_207348 [Crassisporium funariophilum]|nr:hypothetical protein B0H34DRAFT_207348 [Crassisporium funariophilum]
MSCVSLRAKNLKTSWSAQIWAPIRNPENAVHDSTTLHTSSFEPAPDWRTTWLLFVIQFHQLSNVQPRQSPHSQHIGQLGYIQVSRSNANRAHPSTSGPIPTKKTQDSMVNHSPITGNSSSISTPNIPSAYWLVRTADRGCSCHRGQHPMRSFVLSLTFYSGHFDMPTFGALVELVLQHDIVELSHALNGSLRNISIGFTEFMKCGILQELSSLCRKPTVN